jgi:hypothetical protein
MNCGAILPRAFETSFKKLDDASGLSSAKNFSVAIRLRNASPGMVAHQKEPRSIPDSAGQECLKQADFDDP